MTETKHANLELKKFTKMLCERDFFSFQRFADGESWILQGKKFKLSPKRKHHGYKNPEDWKSFDPKKNGIQRDFLYRALQFKRSDYYLGLLVGNSHENHVLTDWMLEQSGQDIQQVTFANLFVNSNYSLFINEFLPEFRNWKIIIVCNKNSVINQDVLPNIAWRFDVGSNCIVEDFDLVGRLKKFVQEKRIKNHLFLFACSSLGNYCIRELAEKETENMYIDCGSTLNPFLGLSSDRAYLAAFHQSHYRGGEAPIDALYQEEVWPWVKNDL
jgi:hypothetical protein